MISTLRSTQLTFGQVRFFEADRCINTEKLRQCNRHKIVCDEIVSFDSGLLDLFEMESLSQKPAPETKQIVAAIVRPGKEPEESLEAKGFTFCGYDLVEEMSGISAITNCGGDFTSVPYHMLTQYGLLPDYKAAVLTQLALMEENPNDSHANCEILEIWRKLV